MLTKSAHPGPDQIRAAFGELATVPGDAAWDPMRQAWNLATNQRPLAVAAPRSVDDVIAIVRFAAERGMRIAAQGTGHGAAPLGPLTDAILVRTGDMADVSIDPDTRWARIGPGVRWRDVSIPAAEHGLAGLSGSSPDVGIVGYTLGGGIGWLARRYGIAANSVRAIEVVTADGELRRVDADHDPDLFWALRGGGGSFGVVTAIEFELYSVTSLYAGNLFWPMDRAVEIMTAWHGHLGNLPPEVTSGVRLFQFPELPDLPDAIRGQSFVVIGAACLMDPAEAESILGPWRALGPVMDTCAPISLPELGTVSMDPEDPVPVLGDGMLLRDFSTDTIEALAAVAGPGTDSPLLMVDLRQLGGALAVSGPDHGALDRLDADVALFALGIPINEEVASALDDRLGRIQEALAPWSAGHYFNFSDRPTDVRSIFSPKTYERLQDVKRRYDPAGVFLANHAIAVKD